MATEISVWQITDGKLEQINKSMAEVGLKETEHLEKWIKTNPIILGQDILIIGEQVRTKSGPLDFLGIDKSGNLIVIELKRDKLPREVLSQAIDYVSDVASWDLDKIDEICLKNTEQGIEDYLNENFGDIDLDNLIINGTQRILLVGFAVDEALERMIEWLSNNYGVSINALILKYIRTQSNENLLARTMIIPEDVEKERSPKRPKGGTQSDVPGTYKPKELHDLLCNYFKKGGVTSRRIKDILIPLCFKNQTVSREMIKEELIKQIKGDCFLIYRTDRADLSKNINRGFMAYELFLQKHPEFHGKVKFLSTGMPTRQQIKEYCDYRDENYNIIDSINERYSKDGWKPIEQVFKADYSLVTAAFKHYDCLLVNPIVDGMNIVAKEGPIVNENNGVLIMSNGAGSYEELKDYSIIVNAYDISQTADAIYRAITMSQEERARLIQGLKKIVNERNVYIWMQEQFKDIKKHY